MNARQNRRRRQRARRRMGEYQYRRWAKWNCCVRSWTFTRVGPIYCLDIETQEL